MALREDIERQGNWLFKWRSYLPLIGLPMLAIALRNSEYLEKTFGNKVEVIWTIFSICVSFLGLGIRCFTLGFTPRGTSGRNTQGQAASVLNTSGMYSVVRHPLYLGNFVIVFGMTLLIQVWWFALATCLAFWMYYERIAFAEEEFLREKFGASFLEWAKKTPVFFPNFKNWKKSGLEFSLKAVLRREYSTFFGIVASLTFLNVCADLLSEGKFELTLPWIIFFILGLAIYLTLMRLKKNTKLLDVKGR